MVKTRGMESNEVFYFQTPEIQEFEKCVMNCVFLLYSVILRNFASMTSTGFLIILAVVCATLIAVVFKMRGRFSAFMHIVVFMCYSGVLWNALLFHGDGGASLVWLFYLLMAYGLHIIVLLLAITRSCKTKKNRILIGVLSGIAILLFMIFCSVIIG